MTTTSKITADNVTESKIAATDIITAKLPTAEMAPEKEREHTRAAITDALVYIYDAISALQKTAFQTNDKVVYGFATKLLNGELMDLKANYSKDGVFAIKAESEEEKTALKTSAPAICDLIIDFFNGEVQEMKVAKE